MFKFINNNLVKTLAPIIIGAVALAVLASITPWDKVSGRLATLTIWHLLILLALSVLFYISRAYRFWVMLGQMGIKQPMIPVVVSYLAAQPMTMTPVGELYRLIMLKKMLGVDKRQSAPTIAMQALIEGVVLLSFAMIGALLLGRSQGLVLVSLLLLVLAMLSFYFGWVKQLAPYANKLPFITASRTRIATFIEKHNIFLRPQNLRILVGLSLIPVVCGVLILFVTVHALGGDLSLAGASIGYSLPAVIASLSFLPGGIGASEGSSIGTLHLLGQAGDIAIAATIILRLFILVGGILFGMLVNAAYHIHNGNKKPS